MLYLLSPEGILIAAAVIPAIALLVMVYRQDQIEREPLPLLLSLVFFGIIATSAAKLLEQAGVFVLNSIFHEETLLYDVLLNFGIIAFAEEGSKYALLKWRTWHLPDFNCRFDGVVYATFVSLGFALWENVGYVFMYGLGTAMIRALTAVPGHACFGVFMGCWYGQARLHAGRGGASAAKACRVLALLIPALLHGAYDFLATMAAYSSAWYFVVFVGVLFLITFVLMKKLSREDRYV